MTAALVRFILQAIRAALVLALSVAVGLLVAFTTAGRIFGKDGVFLWILLSNGSAVGLAALLFRCWPSCSHPARNPLPQATADDQRRIVTITPRAVEFAAAAIAARNYPRDTVLRVTLSGSPIGQYEVKYDVPSDTGRDWLDDSCGITVVVDKTLAEQLAGLTIDVRDEQYVFEKHDTGAKQL